MRRNRQAKIVTTLVPDNSDSQVNQETQFRQHKWSDAQMRSIDRGLADADAGRFASDEEQQALREQYPAK